MPGAVTPRAALKTTQVPQSWNEDQKTARIVISSQGLKPDGFDWAHGIDSIRPPSAPVPLLIDQGMGHSGDVGGTLGSISNFSVEDVDGVPSLLGDVKLDGIEANVERALPSFRNGTIRFSAAPDPEAIEPTEDGIKLSRWGLRHVVATMMPVDTSATMRAITSTPAAMGANKPNTETPAVPAATPQPAPVQEPPARAVAAPPAPVAPSPAPSEEVSDGRTAEQIRHENEILRCCMVAGRTMGPQFDPQAVADGFIGRSLTPADAMKELFRLQAEAIKPAGGAPVAPSRVEMGQEHFQKQVGELEAALVRRVLPRAVDPKQADAGRRFIGATFSEMCRSWLDMAGVSTVDMGPKECIDAAMFPRTYGARYLYGHADALGRAMQTSSTLTDLTSNLANKSAFGGWEQTEQTWRPFAEQRNAQNFKPQTTVWMDGRLRPSEIQQNGEYKIMNVTDGAMSYKLSSYAGKLLFSRQMMIDDDTSTLEDLLPLMGEGIAELHADLVYYLITGFNFLAESPSRLDADGGPSLIDGVAVFDSTHNNTTAGALGIPVMNSFTALLKKQKSPQGRRLNSRLTHLLVPAALEGQARALTSPLQYAPAAETGAGGPNLYGGVSVLGEARLDDVSTDEFYALAAGGRRQPIRYGYLEGEGAFKMTAIEEQDPDGMVYRILSDFYAALPDYRLLARSSGV